MNRKNLQKRIRDYDITIGTFSTGPLNSISDVEGVTVGHLTLQAGASRTGVTAVLPHKGNIYQNKVVGATHIINGYGKTNGTIQVEELGTIETPIILTNTLSVGVATNGLVQYMLSMNNEIGRTTDTVNPIVCECNDMHLNDIRAGVVKEKHILAAIANAVVGFEEGAVGAGTGMKCFGLKGGIGSSSREIHYPFGRKTIGVLVLSNFGRLEEFQLNGAPVGARLINIVPHPKRENEKGSIIILVATDLPVTDRQLKRIIKRATVGLARTGSHIGHGSGDIVIGFSTTNQETHNRQDQLLTVEKIHEDHLDQAFQAVIEATEEAILNSMVTAKTTVGREGNKLYSLADYIQYIL